MELKEDIIVSCPHCNQFVSIEKLNCRIFRHGILKINRNQIDPHASKELCNFYIKNNLIYGCGKPFKIIWCNSTNKYMAINCDYL